MNKLPLFIAVAAILSSTPLMADQVVQDDQIIVGSECVGMDCVNGESFGFDTLRLKENNLRIKFQDTSSSSSFPTNDWQITANDSVNGGLNKFSIDDIDGGKTPFSIIAGAPSNSIYVHSNGFVGFNTSTPLVNLHAKGGNTPTLRLEQDGTSGFAAQAWDIGSNETNFFIRDVTNGSKLPFRIISGASNNSLYIAADGDIGFETSTPDGIFDVAHPSNANDHALLIDSVGNVGINIPNGSFPSTTLDVQGNINSAGNITLSDLLSGKRFLAMGSDANAQIIVMETNATTAERQMLRLRNNGIPTMTFENSSQGANIWHLKPDSTSSAMTIYASATTTEVFSVDNNGNIVHPGTISSGSSRELKKDFQEVDGKALLEKLNELPIMTWKYKTSDGTTHLGPMAEDFSSAFGLGMDEKRLAPADLAGVTAAATQELSRQVKGKQLQINELKSKNSELEQRLVALENILMNGGAMQSSLQKTSSSF